MKVIESLYQIFPKWEIITNYFGDPIDWDKDPINSDTGFSHGSFPL